MEPIKICSIKGSIVKISSLQARINQDCHFFFLPSKNQARIKQDNSCYRRLNQDQDKIFDTKKHEIKNFKQVLLFSDITGLIYYYVTAN
jgi:hypothetical protein